MAVIPRTATKPTLPSFKVSRPTVTQAAKRIGSMTLPTPRPPQSRSGCCGS